MGRARCGLTKGHYHGVMFGVTAEEFKEWFLPLWKFGHVEYSSFDATKGGMMYIAKYCSKGSYDNPLSKKDFFYANGKEYHSDKWIGSFERFGVNLPLADPCFRLMSHGLGIGYAFRKQVQNYWGVTIDTDYVVRSSDVVSAMPSIDFWDHPNSPMFSKRCTVLKSIRFEEYNGLFDHKVVDTVENGFRLLSPEEKIRFYTVRKFNDKGQLLQESVFDTSINAEYINEDYLLSKRFSRAFVYRPKRPTKAPYLSQPNEAKGEYSLTYKTVESALPRYYHRWLVPPSAKLYISSAAIRRDIAAAEDEARHIRSLGTSDAKVSYTLEKLAFEDFLRARAAEDLRKSSECFYNRTDIEDRKDVGR